MIKNHSCSSCENKGCFIWKLSPSSLSWVDIRKHIITYSSKDKIFAENEKVYGLYFIKRGKVKVFSKRINGSEKIFRLAGGSDMLGHRGYGVAEYPVSATALEDSIICFIDNQTLHELFSVNPAFTYEIMMFSLRELRNSESTAKCNAQMGNKERVISAILYAKETFGIDPVTKFLNILLTRIEIAALADTTPEGASRMITQLENEQLVRKKKRRLQLVNEDKLYENIKDFGILQPRSSFGRVHSIADTSSLNGKRLFPLKVSSL